MESVTTDEVQVMVNKGMIYDDISADMQRRFPGVQRGMSTRTVRRFCKQNGIVKPKDGDLDKVVEGSIVEVGASYGRKMMKGYLSSKGYKVSEFRVGESLKRVHPEGHEARRNNTIEHVNPMCYRATHFGHKLHLDQNEKLRAYGVTHVVSRDGYSGKIMTHLTLPVKNNLVIYEDIYRSACQQHGLWDQIRVDHGREFYLVLFIQEMMRKDYGPRDVLPYVQTPSHDNLTVERIWPEVNHRVNYPLKTVVIDMEEQSLIDMQDNTVKFSVSFVLCNVASCGMERFVKAWNSHPISGSGIPNMRERESYHVTPLPAGALPTTDQATTMYTAQGGELCHFSLFGLDPLRNRPDLVNRRDALFASQNSSFNDIFSNCVSADGSTLKQAILCFITITESLEQLL